MVHPDELFAVELSGPPEAPVVAVVGELDAATAPRLREVLLEVVDAGGVELVVDFTRLDFIDSTGLGVLVATLKRIRPAGGRLVVRGAQPKILKILELTGLTTLFQIER